MTPDLKKKLNLYEVEDEDYEEFRDVLTDNATLNGKLLPVGESNSFGNLCSLEAISHSEINNYDKDGKNLSNDAFSAEDSLPVPPPIVLPPFAVDIRLVGDAQFPLPKQKVVGRKPNEKELSLPFITNMPNLDRNGYSVSISFYVVNHPEPVQVETFLERLR